MVDKILHTVSWALFAAVLPVIAAEDPIETGPIEIAPHAAGSLDRVALSEDGALALVSGDDGWTRLWEVDSGRLRLLVPGHHALLSPEGALLITGSRSGDTSHPVQVWEVASGKLRHAWESPPVHCLALSADGTAVAAGHQNGGIRVWDLASGKLLHEVHQSPSWIRQVAFTPDGRRLLASNSRGVVVWDLHNEQPRFRFGPDSQGEIAVSADGAWMVSGDSTGVGRVWDLEKGRMETILTAHEGSIEAVRVTPDGQRAVTAGRDKLACLWNRESGRPLHAFTLHIGPLTSLAIGPDSARVLTGSADRTARLWSLETGEVLHVFRPGRTVEDVAFSGDGSTVAVAAGSVLGVWESESGRLLRKLDTAWTTVESLTLLAEAGLLLAGEERDVHLWHFDGKRPPIRLEGKRVVVTPDGSIAVAGLGCCDGRVRIWELEGQRIRAELGHRRAITSFTLAADGTTLLTGGAGGEVRVWDLANLDGGEPQAAFQGPQRAVTALALDSSTESGMRIYAGYQEGSLVAWDLPVSPGDGTGEERFRARHRRSGPVTRLRPRPGTTELLSTQFNDPAVLVWDVETGEQRRRVSLTSRPQGSVRVFGLGPQAETVIALPPDQPPGVWDLAEGTLRTRLEGHEGDVLMLALDGTRAATGGADRTVRLWDVSEGKPVRVLEGLDAPVEAVALGPDGVVAAAGGTIVLWDAESGAERARLYVLTDGRWAAITPDGHWDAARDGDLPELPVQFSTSATEDGVRYSLLSDHPERRKPGLLARVAPEP